MLNKIMNKLAKILTKEQIVEVQNIINEQAAEDLFNAPSVIIYNCTTKPNSAEDVYLAQFENIED